MKTNLLIKLALVTAIPIFFTGCSEKVPESTDFPSEQSQEFEVSEECLSVMAESASNPYPSDLGEKLLVESGDICKSKEEWEEALRRYPMAIGIVSEEYIDGSEYKIFCQVNPNKRICIE